MEAMTAVVQSSTLLSAQRVLFPGWDRTSHRAPGTGSGSSVMAAIIIFARALRGLNQVVSMA